jgi:hypothetical protein
MASPPRGELTKASTRRVHPIRSIGSSLEKKIFGHFGLVATVNCPIRRIEYKLLGNSFAQKCKAMLYADIANVARKNNNYV